ncbi:MAG: DEAD/DEAH box helicase family protein [Gammaproteobacteria bacterium]|nr:DEAD/DEAH box helicase family protein [Gammaproteobacteria bacterium]
MSLRDVVYKEDYRSGHDNIVTDFFHPSLANAQEYWRAVGYFSSSALESFGAPLGTFIKNGGSIRLVTSIELLQPDLEAIERGIKKKEEICTDRLESIIEEEFMEVVGNGVVRLSRLLEMERLEIRIAIPKTGTGIYHEKIGIFWDGIDFVAFSGSSNESRNAFENNRECIDVFPSWRSPNRARRKCKHFEEVWEGSDRGVDVFSFPEAAKKQLLKVCGKNGHSRCRIRMESKKWRHQEEALNIFVAKERGILNMATGTGKTRTAINILTALYNGDEIDTVIVCTDGNDLLNQWCTELLSSRKTVRRKIRVRRHFSGFREIQRFLLSPENAVLVVSRKPVDSALKQLNRNQGQRTLLIYDEVHGLGSPDNRIRLSGLSDHIRFRLGLSATPERPYDDDGNRFIEGHIGPVLMEFELKEAIKRGILAPFNYYPLPYQPTDDDRSRIAAIYSKKKACEASGEPMSEEEFRINIARVYKTSEAKLPVFKEFIQRHQDLLTRSIVFTETIDYGQKVLEIVHSLRADFHTYFSGEDKSTLERFARGDLECLIACHRLSEGIDIQTLNTVILFSSEKGQLETIQRIGRSLRTNPENPEKIANIVDFIRQSDDTAVSNTDEERRNWLNEQSRVRTAE